MAEASRPLSSGMVAVPPSAALAPPVGGPQSLYLHSSQARSWRFGPEQLKAMQRAGVEQARARLVDAWEMERSLSPVDGEPEASSSRDPIESLNVDEEQALVTYYLTRVRQLVKAFMLPEVVEATAMTFIKRFYLRNTCMDYHPKNIMLTSLFLAAKAESNAIPLRHFSTKLAGKDATPETIADYIKTVQDHEFLVSQSLAFEYMVHGAHKALHGIFLDSQKTVDKNILESNLQDLLQAARSNLQASRLTSLEFLYTPAQIALACVRSASREGADLVSTYLDVKQKRAEEAAIKSRDARDAWEKTERQRREKQKSPNGNPSLLKADASSEQREGLGMPLAELDRILDEIGAAITQQLQKGSGDLEMVKSIDKKLKLFQNPEKLPNSRISKHRAQEHEKVVLGKRDAAKAQNHQVTNGDPFDDDEEDASAQPKAKKVKANA